MLAIYKCLLPYAIFCPLPAPSSDAFEPVAERKVTDRPQPTFSNYNHNRSINNNKPSQVH